MNLVFLTFRDNLLTASQSEILHNSKLIKASTRLMSSLPPWVNEHKGLVIVVSSAYKMSLRLALTLWISFIYIIKSRGPNIEPWNLSATSTALLPRSLSNFGSIVKSLMQIPRLRDFARSYKKMSHRILKQASGGVRLSVHVFISF